MDFPRQLCPRGAHCLYIRRGECPNWHQSCPRGRDCSNMHQMNCSFFHPKHHYPRTNHNPNTNHISSTLHPLTKPANAGTTWTPEQDRQLWHWMNGISPQYHKSTENLRHLAKKNKRTEIAVRVRMDTLTKAHIQQQRKQVQNKRKTNKKAFRKRRHNNNDKPHPFRTLSNAKGTMDIKQIEKVSNVFDALKRYYKKEKNLYEIRNIDALQARLNNSDWKGDMKHLEDIAGVNWEHFEAQFKVFEDKYVDNEMKYKALDVLNKLKKVYERELNDVERILDGIEKRKWCGDIGEFNEICAGKDLVYFERKLYEMESNGDMDSDRNNMRLRRNRESLCDDHRPLKRRKLKGNFGLRT